MTLNEIYVGKIPGYNKNISSSEMKYEDNLLNGITTVTMQPTAYVIGSSILSNIKKGSISAHEQGLFDFGGDVASAMDKGIFAVTGNKSTQTTANAIAMWNSIMASNSKLIGNTSAQRIKILATADSTISESIENQFDNNVFKGVTEQEGDNNTKTGKMMNFIQNIKNHSASLDSLSGINILETSGSIAGGSIAGLIQASVLGIKVDLPQVWKDTTYNSSLSLFIKLISPSGHPDDIQKYINIPLNYLLMAASPITLNGLSYGYPPLWEIHAEGLMYLKLGAISSMIITRGGTDTSFNMYNQPLNIDIRLTLSPITRAFATPYGENAPHLSTRKGSIMTTPHDINRSMNINDPVFRSFSESLITNKYVNL